MFQTLDGAFGLRGGIHPRIPGTTINILQGGRPLHEIPGLKSPMRCSVAGAEPEGSRLHVSHGALSIVRVVLKSATKVSPFSPGRSWTSLALPRGARWVTNITASKTWLSTKMWITVQEK